MGVQEHWLDLRDGERIPSGLAVDAENRLYVALRAGRAVDARTVGGTQVLIYPPDRGEPETMVLPDVAEVHAITLVGDTLLVTDRGSHAVRRFTLDGQSLGILGSPDHPSDTGNTEHGGEVPRPAGPFNGPTQAVMVGDRTYVSDGYGNSRVHAFDPDGRLIASWGAYGDQLGEFKLPHSIAVLDSGGRLLVCDRENSRIQTFAPDGTPLGVWATAHRPTDVVTHGSHVYVVDLSAEVTRRSTDGEVLAGWAVPRSAHNLCVDHDGRIYVTHILGQAVSVITEDA